MTGEIPMPLDTSPFDRLAEWHDKRPVYPHGRAGRAMKFVSKLCPVRWKDASRALVARLRRL